VQGLPVYGVPTALVSSPFGVCAADEPEAKELVRQFLSDHRFDVAHIGHSMRMLPAIEALIEAKLPYVVTLTDFFPLCYRVNLIRNSGDSCDGPHGGRSCLTHCPVEFDPAWRLERFHGMLAGARARVACSDFVRRQYTRAFPELAFETLSHGVDVVRACATALEKREDAGVRFGFLGTLSAIKGVTLLLEAFARADLPRSSLEIIGPAHGDTETRQKIEALAAPSNVSISGPVSSDDVFGVLSRFDVLCLPSQVPETFSLVLHQAFVSGVPALVSDLGAPAEIVKKHGCGWTTPHADVEGWSQALRRIASDRASIDEAKSRVPLPMRIEEEGFFYEHFYRRALRAHEMQKPLL
jgi:glycosyltransferase involved in cell wall biosynthesis